MAEEHRIGPCKMCEYFDYAPADYKPDEDSEIIAPDNAMARCVQHELKQFELTMAGGTSCNRFEERKKGIQVPEEELVSAWR